MTSKEMGDQTVSMLHHTDCAILQHQRVQVGQLETGGHTKVFTNSLKKNTAQICKNS